MAGKLDGVKSEFKKIVWPKRSELGAQTTTVIVTALLIGTIVVVLDFVYMTGLDQIVKAIIKSNI